MYYHYPGYTAITVQYGFTDLASIPGQDKNTNALVLYREVNMVLETYLLVFKG